jgi:histidine kinase
MRSIKRGIVLLCVILVLITTLQNTVVLLVSMRIVSADIYFPISAYIVNQEITHHYHDGGSDATLPATLNRLMKSTYAEYFTAPLITTADGIVLYPVDRAGTSVNPSEFVLRRAIPVKPNHVLYVIHIGDANEIPLIYTYMQYIISAVIISVFISTVIVISLARWLIKRIVNPMLYITQSMEPANLNESSIVAQLPPFTPTEFVALAQFIDSRNHEIIEHIEKRRQLNAEIAHELRNPLNTINGYIEGMVDGVIPVTRNRLEIIQQEIATLNTIITDLRMLSLLDIKNFPIHPRYVRLSDFAVRVRDITIPFFGTHAFHYGLLCGKENSVLWVDPDRFMQVFSNVIHNAVKHTPTNGTITISCRIEGDFIVAIVKDTGHGIPAADLPFIFDRFYRGKSDVNAGSGLGLAIARELMRAQGGDITAESELGHGTTISIYLPFVEEIPLPHPEYELIK